MMDPMKDNDVYMYFTEADRRFFEALTVRLIERLIERFLTQFATDLPGLSRELEKRRRQRRNKGLLTALASGSGAPVPNRIPVPPAAATQAADVGGSMPLAPAGRPSH